MIVNIWIIIKSKKITTIKQTLLDYLLAIASTFLDRKMSNI